MATGLVGTMEKGNKGPQLLMTCFPSSTFKGELVALIAAETLTSQFEDKLLVRWTFANNMEVKKSANNETFDGRITKIRPDSFKGYVLTVDVFGYTDKAGNWRAAHRAVTLYYGTSTVALQDPLQTNGTTYDTVEVGTSGNPGAVIEKDTTNLYVTWLI